MKDSIQINAELFDAGRYAEKVAEKGQEKADRHIYFIGTGFKTNGARKRIESDLDYALYEIEEFLEEGEIMEPGFNRDDDAPPNTYCMADDAGQMVSAFAVYYFGKRLLKDTRLLAEAVIWAQDVIESWMKTRNLYEETKPAKENEYILKIEGQHPLEKVPYVHTS